MKKSIEKRDVVGATNIVIEHPHDDLYLYLRISGAYFMLFAFLFGIISGVGISILTYRLFFQ